MSPSIIDLLVLMLATNQTVITWRDGSIFAECRARVETWEGGLLGWLAELLSCKFCLAHWVSLVLVIVFYLLPGALDLNSAWTVACKTPAVWLAVTRGSQLINDLAKRQRGVAD